MRGIMFSKKVIILLFIFIILIFSSCSESIEKYDADWLASELSFVPDFIEASFFENEILIQFSDPEGKPRRFVEAYYILVKPDDSDLAYRRSPLRNILIERFPFLEQTPFLFYIFDINASREEYSEILGYFNDYTDLTNKDIIQMWEKYNLPEEYRNVGIELIN